MNSGQPDLITTLEAVRDWAYAVFPQLRYDMRFRDLERHINQLIQERSNNRQEADIRRMRP